MLSKMFHNSALPTIIDVQPIWSQPFADKISVHIFLGSFFQHFLTAIQGVNSRETLTD